MENKKRLSNIFVDNGYPRYKVQETLKKHHRKEQPRNEENKTLMLPYTPGLSEDIDVSCRNLPLRIDFTSYGTLGNALTKVKTPTRPFEKKGVIYAVLCECGGTYIGETVLICTIIVYTYLTSPVVYPSINKLFGLCFVYC